MRLRVESYQDMGDFHICVDEDGKHHKIDLMVDGGLGDIDPHSLDGKIVHISRMYAYISIGHDVKIVEEA